MSARYAMGAVVKLPHAQTLQVAAHVSVDLNTLEMDSHAGVSHISITS